jgi:hypothetical protein
MNDIFVGMRRARILIPDNTPLSLLAMVGPEALDWLFAPGAEVWVTDMVKYEALRDPDEGGDQRELHRRDIANWFERNKHLIHEQPTDEGEEYRKAMEAWRLAGMPKKLKPSWKRRGERSILEVLDGVEKVVAEGEAVIAIVDDRKARAAIKALEDVDIDLIATETYLEWLVRRFGIKEAATAWMTIKIATDKKAPNAPDEDPVHIYKIK